MFFRWWRLDEDDKQRVWLLYGWFTALVCFGSCFGAVAAAARMQGTAALATVNEDYSLRLQGDAPSSELLSNTEMWSLRSFDYGWESP